MKWRKEKNDFLISTLSMPNKMWVAPTHGSRDLINNTKQSVLMQYFESTEKENKNRVYHCCDNQINGDNCMRLSLFFIDNI